MKWIWIRGTTLLLTIASLIAWRILAQSIPGPAAAPAAAWSQQDIGPTGLNGSADQTSMGWQVKGAGADIWGGADAFQFVSLPWDGDVQVVARVLSVEKTDPWAKAGVMIRENLTATSPHAFIAWTPEQGAAFIRRVATAGRSKDDAHQAMRILKNNLDPTFQQRGSAGVDMGIDAITSVPSPRWIKLVRQGHIFQAFDSADGVDWEWLGTERISMASRVYVGLAVTSHNPARLCAAAFERVSVAVPPASAPSTPKIGTGDGLLGLYFEDAAPTEPVLRRVDPNVNFDWGYGPPAENIGKNHFRVRWEGELQAQFTEPYALHVVSDDRARLWINGELIIDEWSEHGEQMSTAVINLEAGNRYLVRLDYFENRGRALVRLLWSSPSTPQQVIPQTQLYSHITDQDNDGLPDLWELAHGLNPADSTDPTGAISTARQQYEAGFEPQATPDSLGPWLSQDIGRVGQEGCAESRDGTLVVKGSGADIYANADGFHFLYQPWRGDGQIVTRVVAHENTDPWAKAGVMVRSDLGADASHLMLALTPEHGVAFLKRESKGLPTTQPLLNASPAQPWLKLVRQKSIFCAFISTNGLSWDWLGSESISAGAEMFWGLAVSSHDNSRLATVAFDGAAIDNAPPTSHPQQSLGSGDGLRANYFDGNTGRIVTRVDPTVNFDWDMDCPADGIGPDFFSVRWEGFLEPQSTELYGLHVESDDGARLWLDDQLLIDAWMDHGPTEQTAKVTLEAGHRYALKLWVGDRGRLNPRRGSARLA
jgi:PA14 domain